MDREKRQTAAGGISFLDLLLIVFIVLKLTGVVTWPWLWVLAPFWIPLAIALGIVVICIIIVIVSAIVAAITA